MTNDPIVSIGMLDAATGARSRSLHAYVTDRLTLAGDAFAGAVDDALRQAYSAGLVDGFRQGLGESIVREGIAGDGGEPA